MKPFSFYGRAFYAPPAEISPRLRTNEVDRESSFALFERDGHLLGFRRSPFPYVLIIRKITIKCMG